MDDSRAPADKIWVCMHCGKTGENRTSPDWDANCTLNAKLYFRSMLKFREDGTVEEIIQPVVQKKKEPVAPKIRKETKK